MWRNNHQTRQVPGGVWLAALFWLGVWQLLHWLAVWQSPGRAWLIPSPAQTCLTMVTLLRQVSFYQAVGATLQRVVEGSLLSFGAGLLLAFLAWLSPRAQLLLSGLMAGLKSIPVMAVTIYGILFLPSGSVPVFVCFLMCCPVVYTNLLSGLVHLDKQQLELAQVYQVGFGARLTGLYLPSIMPQIKAAAGLVAGLSWKTVVAGEVLSIPKRSLGYSLMEAKLYLDIPRLFCWVIAIVALSVLYEKLVRRGLRWLWK